MSDKRHVNYNKPCAVCNSRLVLHAMFFADGGPNFDKAIKCPGGQWVSWDAALGIVKLCVCCQCTLPPGSVVEYCDACNPGDHSHGGVAP